MLFDGSTLRSSSKPRRGAIAVVNTEYEPSADAAEPSRDRALEVLFSRIGELSTLPIVALEIVRLANDPLTSTPQLVDAVHQDPTLVMRLMRTINSAFYGLREKVGNLQQAIDLLGFEEVRNLALTSYVSPLFRRSFGYATYTRQGLWLHLVSVGSLAKHIARIVGFPAPHEAFLAGMLHDFGYVLLDQYLHRHFCSVLDRLDGIQNTDAIERQEYGFDHAALAGYVCSRWNLPSAISEAVRWHHRPLEATGPEGQLTCVVALANTFCHRAGLLSVGVTPDHTPGVELLRNLGIARGKFATIVSQVHAALAAAERFAISEMR
jgi:HD-like signal output (HDOD) protein